MVFEKLHIYMQENELGPYHLILYTKNQSKYFKKLSIQPKTVELLEGNIGKA